MKNNNSNEISSIHYAINSGKVPPQATDIEEAVLGAILLSDEYQTTGIDYLLPEYFYKEQNKIIYSAIRLMYDNGKSIDLMTVAEHLRSFGQLELIGGAYYLASLGNRVGSAANIEQWIAILKEKHLRRELINAAAETSNAAFDETQDVFENLEENINRLELYLCEAMKWKNKTLLQILQEYNTLINERVKAFESGNVIGVPTCLHQLNNLFRGWQRSDLIIIAARPSMGKTAFAIQNIITACEFRKKVLFFSLEMSANQIMDRIMLNLSGLQDGELIHGQMNNESFKKYHEQVSIISNFNLIIDDRGGIDISYIRSKLKQNTNIDVVIIDYLQLMKMGVKKNSTREQDVTDTTVRLKALAKEFNVPIIALSQLSRAVENRGGSRRPQLSDLRESGSIEQDADIVMFLYRPEYYGIQSTESGMSTHRYGEVIVAKNRNGKIGTCEFSMSENMTRIFDFNYVEQF